MQPTLEIASSLVEPPVQNNPEVNWVDDDVEYVGLDDEDPYKSLLSDLSDSESDGDVEDDECIGLENELLVEDATLSQSLRRHTKSVLSQWQIGNSGLK